MARGLYVLVPSVRRLKGSPMIRRSKNKRVQRECVGDRNQNDPSPRQIADEWNRDHSYQSARNLVSQESDKGCGGKGLSCLASRKLPHPPAAENVFPDVPRAQGHRDMAELQPPEPTGLGFGYFLILSMMRVTIVRMAAKPNPASPKFMPATVFSEPSESTIEPPYVPRIA